MSDNKQVQNIKRMWNTDGKAHACFSDKPKIRPMVIDVRTFEEVCEDWNEIVKRAKNM